MDLPTDGDKQVAIGMLCVGAANITRLVFPACKLLSRIAIANISLGTGKSPVIDGGLGFDVASAAKIVTKLLWTSEANTLGGGQNGLLQACFYAYQAGMSACASPYHAEKALEQTVKHVTQARNIVGGLFGGEPAGDLGSAQRLASALRHVLGPEISTGDLVLFGVWPPGVPGLPPTDRGLDDQVSLLRNG